MKPILPNDMEKFEKENEIQDRLEAGELIDYEEMDELDDESTALIRRRLEEKGLELVEEPGDGYRAK